MKYLIFLEDETYNKLNLSFPNQTLFSPHNDFARSFSDESDQFSDFLRNNPYWKNFIEEINSKIFVEDLIKFFNLKNVYFSKIVGKNISNYSKRLN